LQFNPPLLVLKTKNPPSLREDGYINANNPTENSRNPLFLAEYLRYTSQLPEKIINL